MIPLATSVAVLFSGFYSPSASLPIPAINTNSVEATVTYSAPLEDTVSTLTEKKIVLPNDGVEARVREYFEETPIMIRIAYCESRLRQFNKQGSVLRGEVVTDDLGVFQINNFFHGEKAEELGYDLHTVEGNMAYAKYLYEKKGTQPWKASKPCWGKDLAVNTSH